MSSEFISFKYSGFFSRLVCDYVSENPALEPFYNNFPSIGNFKHQIDQKVLCFNEEKRKILQDVLFAQYAEFKIKSAVLSNLNKLKNSNTFTVTTGHQLNLFGGPLYFIYKIVTVINLVKELKKKYTEYDFVPVFWMASEDHDFEEINHFNFKQQKIHWSNEFGGPVGRMSTKNMSDIHDILSKQFGISANAEYLKNLFKSSYLKHDSLGAATRYFIDALFGEHGLVIIDGDNATLKKQFIPFLKNEISDTNLYNEVTQTNEALLAVNKSYPIQVNPREINLFYITDSKRLRIKKNKDNYVLVGSTKQWSYISLVKEIDAYPERFSPNALMRPLYQEVILPNLCYVGGGSELNYWLQLKRFFDNQRVLFPILVPRNSLLILTKQQSKKIKKFGIKNEDLFLKISTLKSLVVKQSTAHNLNFEPLKIQLKKQFQFLFELASKTDHSFMGAVAAQEKKQIKGLIVLEKRLLKAEKIAHKAKIDRLVKMHNILFPNQNLQERESNFSDFYLNHGAAFINSLLVNCNPFDMQFQILTLEG